MQKETRTKIVGVTQGKDDGEERQLNVSKLLAGQKLFIKLEDDNAFDPNAIKIFSDVDYKLPLGYLPRELARDLRVLMARGNEYLFFVSGVTGGAGGKSFGCNIRIVLNSKDELNGGVNL